MNSYNLATNAWWPPDEAAAKEYMAYAEEIGLEASLGQFDAVAQRSAAVMVGNESGRSIAAFLSERIKEKIPTSCIRLGDADGNALFPALDRYPHLTDYNLSKISQIYFGDKRVMVDSKNFFLEMVIDGIQNADLIGGPERGTIEKSFATAYADLDVRGMCGMRGVYNYLSEKGQHIDLGSSIWASTWFSRALLPHYFDLLRDAPFVGFITCYEELPRLVQQRSNISTIESILVPMQASIAKSNKNINHYPDAYPEILARIQPPAPGAIYIVAAGILSKAYCSKIKERGGIAIDIGSVADVWMGTISRPGMSTDLIDKWKL